MHSSAGGSKLLVLLLRQHVDHDESWMSHSPAAGHLRVSTVDLCSGGDLRPQLLLDDSDAAAHWEAAAEKLVGHRSLPLHPQHQ